MEDFWREAHTAGGYELLYTPHMASLDLWKTSGHFDFYADGMFDQMEVEGAQYQIKPMNCPFHVRPVPYPHGTPTHPTRTRAAAPSPCRPPRLTRGVCREQVLTYKDEKRSYRDLPLRWAELGTVYRYERSRLAETRREDPGGPVCRDGRPGTVHALLRLPEPPSRSPF